MMKNILIENIFINFHNIFAVNRCPSLEHPDNHGTWSDNCATNNPTYGTVCTLSCEQGYRALSTTVQCNATGCYNETLPVCESKLLHSKR